ncbi:MAG TPA: hypothetical protein VF941_12060 [Clostridia bacterium]
MSKRLMDDEAKVEALGCEAKEPSPMPQNRPLCLNIHQKVDR